MEDNVDQDDGGKRPFNHFYDPLTRLGLSDVPPDHHRASPLGGSTPLGNDSFTWASKRNCPGVDFIGYAGFLQNVGTYNRWSWQNARDYEWLGLTAANKADRVLALADMFRAVGQVVHLLQDTSQPQHARNEHHVFYKWFNIWHSPIETYGETNVEALNYQHAMLNWTNAGFTKLEDFWNRRLYNGSASALNADANGGAKLGLAEFSNGNFVGDRHLYREYFTSNRVEYYPYPSRDTSTDYNQVKDNPDLGMENFTLKNNHPGKAIYIKKNADGTNVNHHTRMNYLGGKGFSFQQKGETPFCTIRDKNVLADYHSILIPKAVEYSAGLLDYFFRGKLEVGTITPDTPGNVKLRIANKSGQALQGGAFHLFYDVQDTRNEMTLVTTTFATTLSDNGMITAEFHPPTAAAPPYTLAYQGTIGVNGTVPLDSIDANIGVAAKRITGEECACPDNQDQTPAPDTVFNGEFDDFGTKTLTGAEYGGDFFASWGTQQPGRYTVTCEAVTATYDNAWCEVPGWVYPDYWSTFWYSVIHGTDSAAFPGALSFTDAASAEATTLNHYVEFDFTSPQEVKARLNVPLSLGATCQCDYDHPYCGHYNPTGSGTFRLRRLKVYPEPNNIRIKNYLTCIKPSLTGCTVPDYNGSLGSLPEFDGNLPGDPQDLVWGSYFAWTTSSATTINSKLAQAAHIRLFLTTGEWVLSIEIFNQSSNSNTTLWLGTKTTGTTPTGTYQKTDGCASGPDCLVIESY